MLLCEQICKSNTIMTYETINNNDFFDDKIGHTYNACWKSAVCLFRGTADNVATA